AGALRTFIGEHQGVDWSRFPEAEDYAGLRTLIGDGDGLGRLQLGGLYPLWHGERLYPAPLHLLGKDCEYRFLTPGEPVVCDLASTGTEGDGVSSSAPILPVKLPALAGAEPLPGAKPLEGHWLTRENLQRVLNGEAPKDSRRGRDLFDEEPRLGIARDNARRTGREGLLYQTRHLRPRAGLALGVTTLGLPESEMPGRGVIRFGGEARPSAIERMAPPPDLAPPELRDKRLLLMLLSHADCAGGWLPPGFEPAEREGVRVWRGRINGVELTLECAVIGKAVREGGWDLARQRPRPVRSLVPAGSVYFCTHAGEAQAALAALQGARIGADTALGRGELVVGRW
ncbi:MAG: hypothetical protein JXM75_10405, partial [Chromatiaceae bacterium]|nr:hypothetical protein [Chromatiaceae bacterium]